jgi:uncharacterized phage-associated protein
MNRFKFDKVKSLNALAYIANRLGSDKGDLHSVFKALYFAEQKHLVLYGRPITGDLYAAMPDGPVPSAIYDICKESRKSNAPVKNLIKIDKDSKVIVISEPNLDEFSESDLECLNEATDKVSGLSYNERREKSHDPAYTQAWITKKDRSSNAIDIIDIARAGGADNEMIKFIREELEFLNAFC